MFPQLHILDSRKVRTRADVTAFLKDNPTSKRSHPAKKHSGAAGDSVKPNVRVSKPPKHPREPTEASGSGDRAPVTKEPSEAGHDAVALANEQKSKKKRKRRRKDRPKQSEHKSAALPQTVPDDEEVPSFSAFAADEVPKKSSKGGGIVSVKVLRQPRERSAFEVSECVQRGGGVWAGS